MPIVVFSVPTTRGGRYDITLDADGASIFVQHELDWRSDCVTKTVYRNAPGLSDGPDQSPVNRHVQLGRAILGLTHGNPVKVHAEGNALDYRKTHLTLIDPNRNLSNSGPAIAPAHQRQGSTSHPPPVVEIDNPPCSKVFSLAELCAMKFDYHPTHYAPRPDTHQADDESDPDTSSVDSTEKNEFHNTRSRYDQTLSSTPLLSPIYSKLTRALISWPDLMLSLQKTLNTPSPTESDGVNSATLS